VKSSLVAIRVFFVSFISLLLFCIVIWKFPPLAGAQSGVPDDVKHDTPGFDVPISIGVIFDLSGSMANKVGKAKEAALQFFKTANPQDEFFLVSFNDRAEVVSAFTSNVEDLQSHNGPSLLNEVTELTGGRAFAVENVNELPDITAKIGAELRNQYILGYHPSNKSHDARWRKIKVKMRAPKGLPPLSIYEKTGYYASSL
jgi:von Willebrand factor type A domain